MEAYDDSYLKQLNYRRPNCGGKYWEEIDIAEMK